jgi:hypothetical protein
MFAKLPAIEVCRMSEIAPAPRTIAFCRDYEALVQAFRARQDELGLSNQLCDELAGLTSGHTDKLLGPSRNKTMGASTIDIFLELFGVSLVLVEDMDKVRRMQSRWERRQQCYVVPLTKRRRVNHAIRENGRLGGLKRAAELSPKLRQEIARKAGKASGRARRRLARQAAAAASARAA